MRSATILAGLLLAAAIAVLAEPLPPAQFPHDLHAFDLEFDCVTCHHETDATALVVPHGGDFESCKRCHGQTAEPAPAQACGNCHHDSPADLADETLSAKVVIHRSCWSCHEVGVGPGASRACGQCHTKTEGGQP